MHGGNAQTSTTAPRYLSLLKTEAAMEVVAVVAMGSEEEYKMQSDNREDGGSTTFPFSPLYSLVRANNHLL